MLKHVCSHGYLDLSNERVDPLQYGCVGVVECCQQRSELCQLGLLLGWCVGGINKVPHAIALVLDDEHLLQSVKCEAIWFQLGLNHVRHQLQTLLLLTIFHLMLLIFLPGLSLEEILIWVEMHDEAGIKVSKIPALLISSHCF